MIYNKGSKVDIYSKGKKAKKVLKPQPVTSIEIIPSTITLKPGETYQLKVNYTPSNAINKGVRYESFNTGVVEVDDNGLITAITEMSNEIIVAAILLADETIRSECKVTVKNESIDEPVQPDSPYNGIVISNEILNMEVGDIKGIVAHTLPYNVFGTNEYILESDNNDVLTANTDTKLIEAISPGTATIKVTTIDGAFTDVMSIEVKAKEEVVISDTEIYTLEPARFNIITGDNVTDEQAIINRNGIIRALEYCESYGYKKLVMPTDTYTIDPADSITLNSDFIWDLNGSTIRINPNAYQTYKAIGFTSRKGIDINSLNNMGNYTSTTTLLNTNNVYYSDVTQNPELTSTRIPIGELPNKDDENQYYNNAIKGEKYAIYSLVAKNVVDTANWWVALYIDWCKGETTVKTDTLNGNLWVASGTAQFFSTLNYTITIPDNIDIDNFVIRIVPAFTEGTMYTTKFKVYKPADGVLHDSCICNGTILGERDEKANKLSNWTSISATEGCCSIVFEEGNNNGIKNLKVCKSPGFNMSSAVGSNANGAKRCTNGIGVSGLEYGNFDDNGQPIEDNFLVRYNDWIDIHDRPHINFGYPLGYMGYDIMRARIVDFYFYDIDKNFICAKKGKSSFKEYDVPEGSYYLRMVLHTWGNLPTSGNSDFGGAIGFIDTFYPPTNNYMIDCEVCDNYSCGFAACGGQGWLIKGCRFHDNGGRMPGCDIDWEDGWEYMQDDVVRDSSFTSYNSLILCAGSNMVFYNNENAGLITCYGRSQNYKFVNNTCYRLDSRTQITNCGFDAQTDRVIYGNTFIDSACKSNNNHGANALYKAYIINNKFTRSELAANTGYCYNNTHEEGSGASGTLYNDKFIGGTKFFIGDANLNNCTFTDTTNMYIRTNVTYNNCIFNNTDVYVQGVKNNGFITCTLNNCNLTNTSLNQTGWSCMCNYILDGCEVNNTNKRLMATRELGDSENAEFSISNCNITNNGYKPIYITNNFGILNLTNNEFICDDAVKFIITGENINSGTNIINIHGNTFSNVQLLDTKYNGNTNITVNEI